MDSKRHKLTAQQDLALLCVALFNRWIIGCHVLFYIMMPAQASGLHRTGIIYIRKYGWDIFVKNMGRNYNGLISGVKYSLMLNVKNL